MHFISLLYRQNSKQRSLVYQGILSRQVRAAPPGSLRQRSSNYLRFLHSFCTWIHPSASTRQDASDMHLVQENRLFYSCPQKAPWHILQRNTDTDTCWSWYAPAENLKLNFSVGGEWWISWDAWLGSFNNSTWWMHLPKGSFCITNLYVRNTVFNWIRISRSFTWLDRYEQLIDIFDPFADAIVVRSWSKLLSQATHEIY